jgi:type IV pilus assembly protein PilA
MEYLGTIPTKVLRRRFSLASLGPIRNQRRIRCGCARTKEEVSMLQRFWERRKDEEGFTLIELMVVVLIIGILIAIALPTFLGARNRANDKAAQSGLRNALAAAKTCFTDHDTYNDPTTPCDSATLTDIETSLDFVDQGTDSQDPNTISVATPTDTVWAAAAFSKAANCFYVQDDSTAGTTYGSTLGGQTGCDGADAVGVTDASW